MRRVVGWGRPAGRPRGQRWVRRRRANAPTAARPASMSA
jgi:hypothetical protein